jgi:hypothetical protein
MYAQTGKQLAQRYIHALSLDFRSFGESSNEEFDVKKIQTLADNEQSMGCPVYPLAR